MKQSVSRLKKISLFIFAFYLVLASCNKYKDTIIPKSSFAGQYLVVDSTETYTLKVESTGSNSFQIREFGGFLNAPLNAVADGNTLTIPLQTFTNPNGSVIKIVGTGTLSTKITKDDTITFKYSVSGFVDYNDEFEGIRN